MRAITSEFSEPQFVVMECSYPSESLEEIVIRATLPSHQGSEAHMTLSLLRYFLMIINGVQSSGEY